MGAVERLARLPSISPEYICDAWPGTPVHAIPAAMINIKVYFFPFMVWPPSMIWPLSRNYTKHPLVESIDSENLHSMRDPRRFAVPRKTRSTLLGADHWARNCIGLRSRAKMGLNAEGHASCVSCGESELCPSQFLVRGK